jgi:hypothetical protein
MINGTSTFQTISVISTHRVRFLLAECDFDTKECDFDALCNLHTHECEYHMNEYDLDKHECYFNILRGTLKLTN